MIMRIRYSWLDVVWVGCGIALLIPFLVHAAQVMATCLGAAAD